MTRPTTLPEWASTAGPTDLIEPSTGKKESGWRKIIVGLDSIPEKPPYQEFNWWQNLVYQWVEKFAEGTLSDNVIYVNKQGNDTNGGRAPDDAKLTIAAAIAAATASESVIVLDSGEYVENFTINGANVFAASATVRGTVTFGVQGGTFVVYRHTGVNNTDMLVAGATNAQAFYEFCISEPNTSNCINIVNNTGSTLNVVGGFLRAETDGITLAQDSEVRLSLRELMVGTETNGIHVNGNNATISGVISLINRWPAAMTNSIGIYAERGRASLTVSRISFPLNIKPYQVGEFGLLFLSCIDIIGDTPVVDPSGLFSTVVDTISNQEIDGIKTFLDPVVLPNTDAFPSAAPTDSMRVLARGNTIYSTDSLGTFTEFNTIDRYEKFENMAHRGFALQFPEDTAVALLSAIRAGASSLEFDVQPSADGTPWVFHDSTVDAKTDGTGTLTSLTDAYLSTLVYDTYTGSIYDGISISKLEDVIKAIAGFGIRIYPEIKAYTNSAALEAMLDIIKNAGMSHLTTWTCFTLAYLVEAIAYDSKIRVALTISSAASLAELQGYVDTMYALQRGDLFLEKSVPLAYPEIIDYARERNVGLFVYTITSLSQVYPLLDVGIKRFCSDINLRGVKQ